VLKERGVQNSTLLHIAAERGVFSLIPLLLDLGLDPLARTSGEYPRTAYESAKLRHDDPGCCKAIELLQFPTLIAACKTDLVEDREIIRQILAENVHLYEKTTEEGLTPRQVAVQAGAEITADSIVTFESSLIVRKAHDEADAERAKIEAESDARRAEIIANGEKHKLQIYEKQAEQLQKLVERHLPGSAAQIDLGGLINNQNPSTDIPGNKPGNPYVPPVVSPIS